MSLILQNLSFTHYQQTVFRNLNLCIPEASIVAIVGPSGTGKSTLLRCIAGLEQPNEGTIHWQEKILSDRFYSQPEWQRNISMVFQDLALWPHINVFEHLQLIHKHKKKSSPLISVIIGIWMSSIQKYEL